MDSRMRKRMKCYPTRGPVSNREQNLGRYGWYLRIPILQRGCQSEWQMDDGASECLRLEHRPSPPNDLPRAEPERTAEDFSA
jgi:hypothetical protein